MKRKISPFFTGLIVLLGIFWLRPHESHADQESYTVMNLVPSWSTGIISDEVGLAGIEVADMNEDGIAEIASCSNGYAYILNETLPDTYDTIWYSENIGCAFLSLGDRNSDGIEELYVATQDGKVLIFDGDDFQMVGTFNLPSNLPASDIKVANVDGDSAQEIIISRSDTTLVYNANTYSKEWQADDFGGSELGIGNIDNDSDIEIVVNNNPAHVLNATLKTQEWAYSGGFGYSMDVGDVDDDGLAEIAYIGTGVYVFDGDSMAIKWHQDIWGPVIVRVADVDEDGISEVITGDQQWGNISGYQGSNGTNLWKIPNPEHGVSGIGTGDTNNDGTDEILWGAGLSSTGKDGLFIGSWVSETVQWESDDLDGPLFVTTGDLDNDGSEEIVMATFSTTSGYDGGTLRVYDGPTHLLEWSTVINGSFYNIDHLIVGQLDADAALEILVGGNNWYDTRLQVYDGLTLTLEWESPEMGSGSPQDLAVMNIDADPVEEIIIALDAQNVQVLNGASAIIQWDSGSLDGPIRDVALGNLDGNANLDLAVITDLSVYVFEVGTWTQKLHKALGNGTGMNASVAIANEDLTGPGELLLFTSDYGEDSIFQALQGVTYVPLWEKSLGNIGFNEIAVGDFDSDGIQEFALLGNTWNDNGGGTLFWVGSASYPMFWEYKLDGEWGFITGLSLSDVDNDDQTELLFGSSSLIQINEIITSSVQIQNIYLPAVAYQLLPNRLYGTVTDNGVSAAGVLLDLRFYNGSSWSTLTTTTTSIDGTYSFSDVPDLNSGQYYSVRYQNPLGSEPNHLWVWYTRSVNSFSPNNQVHIGDFDLANIALATPDYEATVSLPATFQWFPRPASPTDSYELDIYDPSDYYPYAYTNPPLGYVSQFTLTDLPLSFNELEQYVWEIWVYSPDGGYGVSYESRAIYFTDLNLSNSQSAQALSDKTLLNVEGR